MEKLILENTLKVTNAEGKVTADINATLPEMNLIDVLKLQKAQLQVYLDAVNAQIAELEAA